MHHQLAPQGLFDVRLSLYHLHLFAAGTIHLKRQSMMELMVFSLTDPMPRLMLLSSFLFSFSVVVFD
jgi:hypothetical protein